MKFKVRHSTSIISASIFIILALIFFACKNDIEKVQALQDAQNIPSLRIENLDGNITQMGRVTMRYQTPQMLQYNFAVEKYTDFPLGITLYRYAEDGSLEASILADKAIYMEDAKLWTATQNVKVTNAKGELLETDKLHWDQNAKRIYTDSWVRITNQDAIINGQGLESDEQFNNYEVKKISRSIIYVNDKKK
ncbi:MAG: LPS export ABC transporter periplasmic protein LptC [Bacteroidales bacterium]